MATDTKYNSKVEELYERKSEIYHEMKGMMKVEQAEWSPDDEQKFATLDQDIIQVDEEIEREQASAVREARMQLIEEQKDRTRQRDKPEGADMRALREGRLPGKTEGEVRDLGFVAWANPYNAGQSEQFAAKQLGIPIWARSIELRCFNPVCCVDDIQAYECRNMGGRIREVVEQRAQSVGTGSEGGYLAPEGMMQTLDIALLQFAAPRRYSDVVRTADGRSVPWPTVDDTSNTGEIVGENAATNQQDVVFGQVSTTPHMYSSKYVPVSIQLMQDSATNLPALLGRLLGERIGRRQATDFTTGDGASKPSGILTDATAAGVALAADNAPTLANIIDLKHSVDPMYRIVGQGFLISDTVLASIKKITSDGRQLWQAGLASGEPNTIDGDPYFINQSVPTAAATGTKSMAYGQLNKYKIHDGLDIQLRRLDELHALNNQVTFLAFLRSDGVLLDAGTNPVKYATNP